MSRRFEEPTLSRALPIEHAQKIGVIGIRRAQVLLFEPFAVRGNERLDAELHAPQGVRQELHAFFRTVRGHLVDLGELRILLAHALERLPEQRRGADRARPGGTPSMGYG